MKKALLSLLTGSMIVIIIMLSIALTGCGVLFNESLNEGYSVGDTVDLNALATKIASTHKLIKSEIIAEKDGIESFSIERLTYVSETGSAQLVVVVNGRVKYITPTGNFGKVGGFNSLTINKNN